MKSDGIDEVDLFDAATTSDDRNITASLLAKRSGSACIVALIPQSA